MLVPSRLVLTALAVASALPFVPGSPAQSPAAPSPTASAASAPPAQEPTETIRTGTQIVVVDVSVTDHSGNPVRGLKASDFALTEGKASQDIRHFEEHGVNQQPPSGPPLKLPPGTFTDYSPVPPDSTLNVLLIDTLNTPMSDQSFLRSQLADYVKKIRPGTRMAIFGMSSRLYMLQGFTSDPEVLKNAVEHKLLPRASMLLDDPAGTNTDSNNLSDMTDNIQDAEAQANLQQFEAQVQSFQTQQRMQYTLDAFDAMAHYLSSFPGRKNLIWFSGSFPISISPDPSLADPFGVMADVEDEFRETTNLLTRAQVAVYPVDARGLMTLPMMDASNSGKQYVKSPGAMNQAMQKFSQSQANEHGTMEQMAESTGGKAFYNTNGLADATAKAINAGSNYYTLSYSPSNHNWNGDFRPIHVSLSEAAKAQGDTLTYRKGYYADDPYNPKKPAGTASLTEAAAAESTGPAGYARLAMQRGAPAPSDILMKVRVAPASATTTDTLAEKNLLSPTNPLKPPFRNYDVDLVALARDMGFQHTPDNRYADSIDVKVMVYDVDGHLLNITSTGVKLNLTPEEYQKVLQMGVRYHAQVSTPARGESFVRIGVHDGNTNHFGVVEVPTSAVSRLPADAPATPPAASPKPPAAPPTH
jgi:VWFA-related protein